MNGNDSRINILDVRRLVDDVCKRYNVVQIYRTDVSKGKKHQQCSRNRDFFKVIVKNCQQLRTFLSRNLCLVLLRTFVRLDQRINNQDDLFE